MPKVKRKLTEAEIKNAKPKAKAYKLLDGENLLLLVRPTGKKVWQVRYAFKGKANLYTIGEYDPNSKAGSIGSAEARKHRDEVQALVKTGIDPNDQKKQHRQGSLNKNTTFEAIALEWYGKQLSTWDARYAASILRMLKNDAFPQIGYKQIAEISRRDVIDTIEKVEARNALDVAKRLNKRCEEVFDYAILKELCENNPATGLTKIIKKYKPQGRPYLREEQLPEFLQKLDDYQGGKIVKLALRLLLLTFVRPGELRFAQWSEIDINKQVWRIPAARMKMDREHVVPLSRQAIKILEEIRDISGNGELVFPGERGIHKPISDMTLLKAINSMKYTGKEGENSKIVPHGFRSTASTILNENGFNRDAIERQLAHVPENKIRGAYNHAEYLKERTEMMQWYADHLETRRTKS